MSRIFSVSTAILLLLLPAMTQGASAPKRHLVVHWHGYGFLPGYHQPPNNNVPVYGPGSNRRHRICSKILV